MPTAKKAPRTATKPTPRTKERKQRESTTKTSLKTNRLIEKKESGSKAKGTNSKTAQVVALLQRPERASLQEMTDATGWQTHSIRGFLSGVVGKKMGLAVTSTKGDDGIRRYSVQA